MRGVGFEPETCQIQNLVVLYSTNPFGLYNFTFDSKCLFDFKLLTWVFLLHNENAPKVPELPSESMFKCPICMDPFIEEMSTMCGHIFCKKCITTVVATQRKCPTCRKFIIMEELRRVFLPYPNWRYDKLNY